MDHDEGSPALETSLEHMFSAPDSREPAHNRIRVGKRFQCSVGKS